MKTYVFGRDLVVTERYIETLMDYLERIPIPMNFTIVQAAGVEIITLAAVIEQRGLVPIIDCDHVVIHPTEKRFGLILLPEGTPAQGADVCLFIATVMLEMICAESIPKNVSRIVYGANLLKLINRKIKTSEKTTGKRIYTFPSVEVIADD